MTSSPFFFSPYIASNAALPAPYAFWPMQEGTGATLNDSIGSINLTIVGATWATTGRNGTNCLVFASSQWAWVADPFYLEEFTLCAWVYPTTTGAGKIFLSKRNTSAGVTASNSNQEWQFGMNGDLKTQLLKFNSAGATILTAIGTTVLSANTLYHVAFSTKGNGETTYIYVNGVEEGSGTQTEAMNDGTAVLMFGGMSASITSRYYIGRMQEVRIYNQALTAEQVAAVFALPTP